MAKRKYTWAEFTKKRERYRKAAQGLLKKGYNDAPIPYISTQKELKAMGYTAEDAIKQYNRLFRYYSTAEQMRRLGKKYGEKIIETFGKAPIRFYQTEIVTKQKNGNTVESLKTSGTPILERARYEVEPPEPQEPPTAAEYAEPPYSDYTEADEEPTTGVSYTDELTPDAETIAQEYTVEPPEPVEPLPTDVSYTHDEGEPGTEGSETEYTEDIPSERDIRSEHVKNLLGNNEFGQIITDAIEDYADLMNVPEEMIWDDFIFNEDNARDLETFDIIYTRYREESGRVLPSVVQHLLGNLYGGVMPSRYRFDIANAIEQFNETYYNVE